MKTAEERFNAWKEAESNRENEGSEERLQRLALEVNVCEDLHEEAQKQGDAKKCMITAALLSNAKFLLSCFAALDGAPVDNA